MSTVRALARVEGRRLLRHPAFLVAALLGLQLLLLEDPGDDFLEYKVLVGAGLVPMALGTGVATILAASRARRDTTEELYLSLPSPPASRAAGQLLAVGWAAAAGAVVIAALALVLGPWGGTGEVTPGLVALAQGPVLVALVGVDGVALGARFPSSTAAPRWCSSAPTFRSPLSSGGTGTGSGGSYR